MPRYALLAATIGDFPLKGREMFRKLSLLVCGICLFQLAVPAHADIFDLAGDFSDSSNPNGVWGFRQGSVLLTHFPQPVDGNALNSAAGNGFWGVTANFSGVPFILRTTQSGSATPPYNNGDFLAGDVIGHSSNSGAEFRITWTAPSAGNVSYSGAVWYAHSIVTRSNDYMIDLNGGAALNSGTVTNGQDRSNASVFSSGLIAVQSGDVLSLTLARSAGQSFGSISGVDWTLDFSAIPEPGSALLLALAGTVMALRRRQR
jgi:hypothetical protein